MERHEREHHAAFEAVHDLCEPDQGREAPAFALGAGGNVGGHHGFDRMRLLVFPKLASDLYWVISALRRREHLIARRETPFIDAEGDAKAPPADFDGRSIQHVDEVIPAVVVIHPLGKAPRGYANGVGVIVAPDMIEPDQQRAWVV